MMDALAEIVDKPITIRDIVTSKTVWLTIIVGYLLYRQFKKKDTQIDNKSQSQGDGSNNSQNMTENNEYMSNNRVRAGQDVRNIRSSVGRQYNIQGNTPAFDLE